MKTPKASKNSDHCSELLLPYVDGLLGPPEKHTVEEHLKQCAECSKELNEIRETVSLLMGCKEAFCPEPWQIYEFLNHGRDDGSISGHIQHCDRCREMYQELLPPDVPEKMPAHVREALRKHLSGEPTTQSLPALPTETLFERFRQWLKFPAFAAGAAVAVLLIAVLLRVPDMPQSTIALSSASWEGAPKPKSIRLSKEKATIVLVLKDFNPPWTGTQIDSLYQALTPTIDMCERFSMVAPDTFGKAIDRQDRELTDTHRLVERVGKKLGLSICLVITVKSEPGGVHAELSLFDISSGRIKDCTVIDKIPYGEMESKIRESTLSMFKLSGTGQ